MTWLLAIAVLSALIGYVVGYGRGISAGRVRVLRVDREGATLTISRGLDLQPGDILRTACWRETPLEVAFSRAVRKMRWVRAIFPRGR